jgi:hypothetical protein
MGVIADIAAAIQNQLYKNPYVSQPTPPQPGQPGAPPVPPQPMVTRPPVAGNGAGMPAQGVGARDLNSRQDYINYVEQATPTGQPILPYDAWMAARQQPRQ